LSRSIPAFAIALAAVCAGCGADDDDEPAGSPVESTALAVTLDVDGAGGKPPSEAELVCPDRGPESSPAACAAATGLTASDADPVPPDTPCTKIYGGPDVVTLAGMLGGEQVDAQLTRADGCEIERFEPFVPLLESLFDGYRPGADGKG
jgi:hypothetical protein